MNKLFLESSKLKVCFKTIGAELISIKNYEGLEYIWQGDTNIWARNAPVLFPIVGKLKEDSYFFENKKYQLSQHGFARDKVFTLKEQNINSCTFELKSDAETKTNFPFDFNFQIQYTLLNNVLDTKYLVNNPSNKTIYFSVGAHPGFRCPLLPNEVFEDYYLEMESDSYILAKLENGLRKDEIQNLQLKSKSLALNKHTFDNDALVFENSQINKISLRSKKSNHGLMLKSSGWPNFGIWSKKACEQFVCLEPWYGIADKKSTTQEFTQKDSIIALGAKKEFTCSFSITFF